MRVVKQNVYSEKDLEHRTFEITNSKSNGINNIRFSSSSIEELPQIYSQICIIEELLQISLGRLQSYPQVTYRTQINKKKNFLFYSFILFLFHTPP